MLSIAWIVLDEAYQVVPGAKANHIIRPDGFDVPLDSTMIHGITREYAEEHGKCILDVFAELRSALEKVHTIVAHNIEFDVHILKSELHRHSCQQETLRVLNAKRDMYCTMQRGKEHFDLKKFPKLKELYAMMYDEPMINPHDALHDAWHCCKCFIAMRSGRGLAAGGGVAEDVNDARKEEEEKEDEATKTYELDDEQMRVVYAPIEPARCTLVLACAGSGKTSTSIARIKHLIDSGAHAASIMLTTFTHNAATDMRDRLIASMGDRADAVQSVWLGTFDSISLQAMTRHAYDATSFGRVTSGNYCSVLAKFMDTAEGKLFTSSIRYLFVDEFQDINDVQYDIIQRFADGGAFVTCVGDDSQNIYTFRDSNVRYITEFATLFRDPEILHLSTNYRSSDPIVQLANASVRMNPASMKPDMVVGSSAAGAAPAKPHVHYFGSCDAEATFLRSEIARLRKNRVPPDEIAVLAPRNKDLYVLEEHLTKHDVPHVLLDGGGGARRSGRDHVCLSTIHKAKGLEWRYVFVIGLNDAPFPFDKHADAIQEGRRLFYVAITRARESLTLCCTRFFTSARLTRYICELDRDLFGAFHNCYPHQLQTQSHHEDALGALVPRARSEDEEKKEREVCDWTSVPSATDCVFAFADSDLADLDATMDAYNLRDVLDTFVRMMFGCMLTPTNASIRECVEAVLCVSGAVLDFEQRMVYQEHKATLEACLPLVQDLMAAVASPLKKTKTSRVLKARRSIVAAVLRRMAIDMGKKDVSMTSEEVGTILQILCKLEKIQRSSGLPLQDIPIIRRDQQLRTEFIETINHAYARYREVCDWQEVQNDVWELARCVCIAKERRRRLMYSPSASDECKMRIMHAVTPILHAMHAHACEVLDTYARVTCVTPCVLLHKDSGHADLMHIAAAASAGAHDSGNRKRMDDLMVLYDAKIDIESTTEYRIDSIIWINALTGSRVVYTFTNGPGA
jgi:DNA polymerase III epsilon subunit-like protein